MFCCFRLVLSLLLLRQSAAHVFLDGPAASQVLIRSRRANSFLEELKEGNMERECLEERCDQEEAREIFEDKEKTDEFWTKYVDGDACESQPCNNGGTCKDGIGTYTCYCQEGYKGFNCQIDHSRCSLTRSIWLLGEPEVFSGQMRYVISCQASDSGGTVSFLHGYGTAPPILLNISRSIFHHLGNKPLQS